MKKIIMLLMVSVFFLMGGEYESMAQRGESEVVQNANNSQSRTLVLPGSSFQMTFYVGSVTNWYSFTLCAQRPEGGLQFILILYRDGRVYYQSPQIANRFSISFDASRNAVYVWIYNVQVEDTGDYYLFAQDASGSVLDWFGPERLEVGFYNPPIN